MSTAPAPVAPIDAHALARSAELRAQKRVTHVQARLRVLFAVTQEPEHHLSFSGAFRLMMRALEAEGFWVEAPGHAAPLAVRLGRALSLGRWNVPITRSPAAVAAAIERALSPPSTSPRAAGYSEETRASPVVFAPLASEVVPLLPLDVPVVYFSDATPRLLQGGYVSDDRATPEQLRRWDRIERDALCRATRVVYASQWAADSAIGEYGMSPERITIAPFGSPLETSRANALSRRLSSPLRLLWTGADWDRKGGTRAVETVRLLRSQGVHAELHMCGARDPAAEVEGVIHHGFLDRSRRRHLRRTEQLMRDCHIFLLPTRADCSPLVLAEAAAWGMPAVSTCVGGVPEIIEHNVTGVVVDAGAPASAFVEAIRTVATDADVYAGYVERARNAWEGRLTWRRWGALVGRAIGAASARDPDQRTQPHSSTSVAAIGG